MISKIIEFVQVLVCKFFFNENLFCWIYSRRMRASGGSLRTTSIGCAPVFRRDGPVARLLTRPVSGLRSAPATGTLGCASLFRSAGRARRSRPPNTWTVRPTCSWWGARGSGAMQISTGVQVGRTHGRCTPPDSHLCPRTPNAEI